MQQILTQAARLQQLVPDAVLVGGTASAVYAGHRSSLDDDHVVLDLANRFDLILEALEREGDWVTNRLVYGKIILGELGGIETGVRQLIRKRPLEFTQVQVDGHTLNLPTLEEMIRIKAFLIVKRNQRRDYLDFAALADTLGIQQTAQDILAIDDYYSDVPNSEHLVLSQLLRQLSAPAPKDTKSIQQLPSYKGVTGKWKDWSVVQEICQKTAKICMEANHAEVP
jgi:hypothetical protein